VIVAEAFTRITDRKQTRMELTDLIRFKGNWYCGFREGEIYRGAKSEKHIVTVSAE